MGRFFLVSYLLFFSLTVNAQVKTAQQKLDSILLENQNHPKEDSMKVVILRQVYIQYMRLKATDKIEEYKNKTIAVANKIGQIRPQAAAYYNVGMYFHGQTNYQKAEENYINALEKYIACDDLFMIASTYLNMGALYNGIPDYAKALEANQKAIPIYIKLNNEANLASCYTNVAEIYKSLHQQSNALTYLQKALKIFLANSENNRGVAVVYNAIGSCYIEASDEELAKMGVQKNQCYTKALENLNKGLKVAQILDDATVMGPIHQDLGTVYKAMGNRALALKSYLKALDYNKLEDDKSAYSSTLLALSDFYTADNELKKAEDLLLEALDIGKENKLLELLKDVYLKLSLIEEKKGNFNQSLIYYRQYISYKDQVMNKEKEQEITRRQLQLDFSVKENDYQLKQKITDGELQRQVLLAKQQQQKLILRQQQLALSDKEKSLQRLTFLKKEADLENEKTIQSNLRKEEQLRANLDKEVKNKEISLQRNEINFNKKVNIFLGVLALILFGSAMLVYRAQRKTARLNVIVSEQKVELEKLGKVKDRIFSVVSHDMRTPVNSLISFIQLLENGNISQEKLTRYAGNLKTTLGYTSSMMENLLNWASSQMQGFKPLIENFDIELCIQEVVNALYAIAVQKNINIANHVEKGLICAADMNMTSLVFRNLISNAIKFTPENGEIILSSTLINGMIAVSIVDNGVGLSTEQVTNFNVSKYQEIGRSTKGTNKEKGTGIGLLLSKTFTALMHGLLQVKSEPGKGSEFTLILPKAS